MKRIRTVDEESRSAFVAKQQDSGFPNDQLNKRRRTLGMSYGESSNAGFVEAGVVLDVKATSALISHGSPLSGIENIAHVSDQQTGGIALRAACGQSTEQRCIVIDEVMRAWDSSLDLCKSTFEACKTILDKVTFNIAGNDISQMGSEKLHEWAAAAIWVQSHVEKCQVCPDGTLSEAYGPPMRISRLLDCALLKRSNTPIQIKDLPSLTTEFKLVVTALQPDLHPVLYQRLTTDLHVAETLHQTIARAFGLFDNVFRGLLRHTNSERMGLAMGDEFLDAVHRFAWIFFLVGADAHFTVPWPENDVETWCLYCVLFVAIQLPVDKRRMIREVLTFVGLENRSSVDQCIAGGVQPDADWRDYYTTVRKWFCEKYNKDTAQFLRHEQDSIERVLNMLIQHKTQPFKHEQIRVLNPQIPWSIYDGALDPGRLLYSNIEDLSRWYDTILLEKPYEFDGRLFRPLSRTIATPRRFCRTPRMSVTKSASSRSLKAAFERASVFNNLMAATPYMARSISGRGTRGAPTEADRHQLQEKFAGMFANDSLDQAIITCRLLASYISHTQIRAIINRVETVTANLPHDPIRDAAWSYGVKLYYRLMEDLLGSPHARTSKEFYQKLVEDGQFHRCLLFISLEIVRYMYKFDKPFTNDLIHQTQCHVVVLAMMLKLVQQGDFWLPGWMSKRLVEIEERVLETELWKCRRFYPMLRAAAGERCDDGASPMIPKTAAFYGSKINPTESSVPGEIKGIQCLLSQATLMSIVRLRHLCTALHLSPDTAQKLLEWGFKHEHRHHLLQNRHVDVYVMACVYAAAKMEGKIMTFKSVVEGYRKQPQFDEKTATSIYISQSEPSVDLITYYNRVFLPILRTYMNSIDTNSRAAQSTTTTTATTTIANASAPVPPPAIVPSPSHHRLSALRPPIDSSVPTMTPRTRRYCATESPLTTGRRDLGSSRGPVTSMRRLFGADGRPPRLPDSRPPRG
ncbi:uncharacterized protein SPPG_07796 [Spizellomyces punctatus DAOM BR117]|uniref:Retinoblastoma-associated protein A-box domain-containing protein n=1 Tax=Spizellomyces punctatus (strain DAOM BR117) TaxID=645134 RepID=A0A0L0H8G7_SPIPD|nr:uncharacterized protein SPPG_07796 [Spizellomyces punctatus DAOM BR117]KNC96978.1 hypothetical protein SPPG_07796 [Spizellomyces punctatus DAOM BR117]|eukprot:XP_016605018.1 hypothetical protein SPPG_07796 [Spizellomyces punctatus DAOM BR117]